jgi:hypothetical protein
MERVPISDPVRKVFVPVPVVTVRQKCLQTGTFQYSHMIETQGKFGGNSFKLYPLTQDMDIFLDGNWVPNGAAADISDSGVFHNGLVWENRKYSFL